MTGTFGSITVDGYLDGAVIVNCKYDLRYKNSKKYFYKGKQTDYSQGVKLGVGGKKSANGKFTLYDTKQGIFMVLVTQLTKEDKGSYQCVVDKTNSKPVFSSVTLEINPGEYYAPSIVFFTINCKINFVTVVITFHHIYQTHVVDGR